MAYNQSSGRSFSDPNSNYYGGSGVPVSSGNRTPPLIRGSVYHRTAVRPHTQRQLALVHYSRTPVNYRRTPSDTVIHPRLHTWSPAAGGGMRHLTASTPRGGNFGLSDPSGMGPRRGSFPGGLHSRGPLSRPFG